MEQENVAFDVIMLATPEIARSARRSQASWSRYCERHGYSFVSYHEDIVPSMHINWSKIEMMRRHLCQTHADWVLLVDANTYVARGDVRLGQLVAQHGGKELIFSSDGVRRFGFYFPHSIRGAWTCRSLRAPAAGFMLVRNSALVRDFFDHWLALARGELRHLADRHPRNQNVLWSGLYRRHRHRIGLLTDEVTRVGTNRLLDLLSPPGGDAFVIHDKRLTRRGLTVPN